MAPPDSKKKILKDFIEIYKSNPCLWHIKNKDYYLRDKKDAAYKLLVEKLREIEPNATRSIVVKKINNLRSNVRKEKRKYELSLKTGSDDDVYRSKLWYYDLFNFLNNQCTTRKYSYKLDSDDENSCEEVKTEYSSNSEENSVCIDNEGSSTLSNKKCFKTKRKYENLGDEVLESVQNQSHPRTIKEDRCDIIGRNIAMKLKTLDIKQMIVAEKLINDLLFEAEIGNLTHQHAYINMRDVLKRNNLKSNSFNSFNKLS